MQTVTPVTSPASLAPDMAALTAAIGMMLAPIVAEQVSRALASMPLAGVDAGTVERMVREQIALVYAPTRIEITHTDAPFEPPTDLGLTHKQFPELLALIQAGRNVWLHGPAGSGKTHAVSQIAKALGREYRMQGAIADRYADLLGYKSVTTGKYQRTTLRDSVEHGGVHLIDEIDASQDPGTPLAINALLANHRAPFPDGLVTRHRDFVLIAAANTKGLGADSDYVGRIRFDGAFLDRFTPLDWAVDETLERALWPDAAPRVQEVRRRAANKGVRVLITPRASERLQSLMGMSSRERAERLAIGGLMTDSQWSSVK